MLYNDDQHATNGMWGLGIQPIKMRLVENVTIKTLETGFQIYVYHKLELDQNATI